MNRRGFLGMSGLALGAVATGGIGALIDSHESKAMRAVGRIAFTFDDGPGEGTTRTREILDENGIKGTFFIVGNHAAKGAAVVDACFRQGHSIQNHSWSHADLTKTPDIASEITPCSNVIESITGARPKYIRPPYGAINDEVRNVCASLDITPALWNVSWTKALDSPNPTLTVVEYAEANRDSGRNNTVLFHDATNNWQEMLYYLPTLIAAFRALNYEFTTIG